VSGQKTPYQEPLPAEEVRGAVERVLSRPEFSDETPWWERLSSWVGERLDEVWEFFTGLFEDVPLPDAPEGLRFALGWLLALLLAVLLGWIFVRFGGKLPVVVARGRAARQVSQRVQQLRRRAREARAAGDLPLALRLTFFALVVGLGRRGNLEYRDAWTNRELLARGRPSSDVSSLLSPLVEELDRKMFGHDETTEADVERLEALCARWLGSGGGAA